MASWLLMLRFGSSGPGLGPGREHCVDSVLVQDT